MDNDNKYYTPSLDEFCPGFEYEVFEGSWCKCIAAIDREYGADKFIKIPYGTFYSNSVEVKCVRVKLLDDDDLNELRWIKSGDRSYLLKPYNIEKQKDGQDNWPTLFIHPDGNIIILRSPTGTCLFDGQIKNKYVLKMVMKLINIQ